jgi:hypothetical protein
MNITETPLSRDKSTEIMSDQSKTTHDRWVIISAAPKYKECLRMKRETFEKRKELFGNAIEFLAPTDTIRYWFWDAKAKEKGGSISETLKCLPDTIDPRQ